MPRPPTHELPDLPWPSAIMRTLERDIACAIESDARVMISGEAGAGRKSVARLIHQRSRRGAARFAVATCHDLAASLAAFTPGSESGRRFAHALAARAGNGTLLIDDIEEMPAPIQLELMQFIESGETHGGELRLITTSSGALYEHVRSHQFRDDLFYRLNVIHLMIPPLRERPEDIPILLQHYLSHYAATHVRRLSAAAEQCLVAYPWPGNVGELKAAAETLAIQDLSRMVEPDDLPASIGRGVQGPITFGLPD